MGGEEGTCNGDGLGSDSAINCFKDEALTNGFGNGLRHDAGEASYGANGVIRTYKRRKLAKPAVDRKVHHDGGASSEAGSQSVDQSCWRKVVLENVYQSLSDDEGGIQGCIREVLSFHPDMDCMATVKVSEASDKVGLESYLQSKLLSNGIPNGTNVGAVENGSLPKSNPSIVNEKCRQTFSNILMSEKFTALCKLLIENFEGIKADSLFDLKVINSRTKDGTYEKSPLLFADDVQQVWNKFQAIGTEMSSLAKSLSDASRTFCKEQFCTQDVDFNFKPEHAEGCPDKACSCSNCGEEADGSNCLVCDFCEEVYHVPCIDPAGEGIPTKKSWYCDRCTTSGIGSLHENCVVCDNLNAACIGIDQGTGKHHLVYEEMTNSVEQNSHCSTAEAAQLFEGSNNLSVCKICSSEVHTDSKFRICEHPFCPSKCYHARCLTSKQRKSYGPCWYCPSCLCRACLVDRDDDKIVLCDGCDHAYHIYCMNPPRTSIPEGKWFCQKCDARIQRIREAKRAYEKLEKNQNKKSKVRKRTKLKRELNGECMEESEKVREGMDMLLNAAKTLNFEENLAAIQLTDAKDT